MIGNVARWSCGGLIALVAVGSLVRGEAPAPVQSKLVHPGANGHLTYTPYSERGDTIPDFSTCGYGGGGVALPVPTSIPNRQTLSPEVGTGDDLPRIQAAIMQVSSLPLDPKTGFRGAILLKRGTYRLSDSLKISASGVVLRGEGPGENGTILLGTTRTAYVLIDVKGKGRAVPDTASRQAISDTYVPVGAKTVTVADASHFKTGDTILVIRHGNAAWIHEIAMDRILERPGHPGSTKQWQPFDLPFDRVVTRIEGNKVTFDAPIACAIDSRWGGGEIVPYADAGRIEKVGVENLHGTCEFDRSVTKVGTDKKPYLADEAHANRLVAIDNVKNGWARDLSTRYMDGVSHTGGGSKWVTVQDCRSMDPVSVITGGRRYPYDVGGQLALIQRCYARDPRHAFVVGSRVCGPNVFLDCVAEKEHATSEPHHRWSVGGLYDNVTASMAFQDRQWMGSGHGWARANYVAWNCAGSLVAQQPPTAQNFAIGQVGSRAKGAFSPRADGYWESIGQHVSPRSLYLTQLADRKGPLAIAAITISAQRTGTGPFPRSLTATPETTPDDQ